MKITGFINVKIIRKELFLIDFLSSWSCERMLKCSFCFVGFISGIFGWLDHFFFQFCFSSFPVSGWQQLQMQLLSIHQSLGQYKSPSSVTHCHPASMFSHVRIVFLLSLVVFFCILGFGYVKFIIVSVKSSSSLCVFTLYQSFCIWHIRKSLDKNKTPLGRNLIIISVSFLRLWSKS